MNLEYDAFTFVRREPSRLQPNPFVFAACSKRATAFAASLGHHVDSWAEIHFRTIEEARAFGDAAKAAGIIIQS